MSKSVREQLQDAMVMKGGVFARQRKFTNILLDNIRLFADAEDTRAALAASQSEVARLRGVIEQALSAIEVGRTLDRPDLGAGLISVADFLRAALQPQPVA